jgi:5,10-methenyltetrahydrofolate synthetase
MIKKIKPTKSELRQTLRKIRLEMPDEYYQLTCAAIVKRLKDLVDWSAVETVHYFEPIHELLEVDISSLVTNLEDNYPDIQLFAPRLIGGVWQMVSIKNEPAPASFDVIIVPMLGFDPTTLHRIGYGGGYYDKFLVSQPKAKKIGVCFESGKTASIPVESDDVSLDIIVTEVSVYTK